MRKVKVYSTAFGLKAINSTATTWGELQAVLAENGVSYNGMNAVENVGNTTLVLNEARLPEGDFVLMLTPIKTKSGSDYKLVRAKVVEIITKYGIPAKEHFNQGGRNYTNKNTGELLGLITLWNENNNVKTVAPAATPVATPVTFVAAKLSFTEALRAVLSYDEIEDYEDLESHILDVIDAVEYDGVNETSKLEGLSDEENEWINKMKEM